MTDNDTVALGDPEQAFAGFSDSELLAFWAATAVLDEVDDTSAAPAPENTPETVHEAALIGVAWQELVRRSLLPR